MIGVNKDGYGPLPSEVEDEDGGDTVAVGVDEDTGADPGSIGEEETEVETATEGGEPIQPDSQEETEEEGVEEQSTSMALQFLRFPRNGYYSCVSATRTTTFQSIAIGVLQV